jgi:hypothetical protein
MPVDKLDAAELVALLSDPHRYFPAYQRLLTLGASAADAARIGLRHHPNPRSACAADRYSITSWMRPRSAHCSACLTTRRRRSGSRLCTRSPATDARTMPVDLTQRPRSPVPSRCSYMILTQGCELVGAWVHSHPDSAAALQRAAHEDRKQCAGRRAPIDARDAFVVADAARTLRHGAAPGRAAVGDTPHEVVSCPVWTRR